MRSSSVALFAGFAGSVAFLWLFLIGVGYPIGASSLLLFVICVVSAASLIFNSRRSLALATAAGAAAVLYSGVVILGTRGPLEYAAAALAALYFVAAVYSLSRFGRSKYLTPLDMPVYG